MLLYFMPSEIIVPSALFVFGTDLEVIVPIIMLVVSSTTIGQVLLFHITRSRGKDALFDSSLIRVSEDKTEKYEEWFDKWGYGIVPISNTLPFVRGLLTIPAGLSDIGYRRFVLLSASGSLMFQCIITILYLAGTEMLSV